MIDVGQGPGEERGSVLSHEIEKKKDWGIQGEAVKDKALWSIMVSLRETREACEHKGRELQKEAGINFGLAG